MSGKDAVVGDTASQQLSFAPSLADPSEVLGSLVWGTPEERRASIARVYAYTTERMERNAEWYLRASRRARRWAKLIRFLLVFLVFLAAILPILQSFEQAWLEQLPPALASLLLILATFLLGLDKHFGYTSTWTRSMLSYQQLQASIVNFRLRWQEYLLSKLEQSGYGVESVVGAIEECRKALESMSQLTIQETLHWAREFTSALQQLEGLLQQRTESISASSGSAPLPEAPEGSVLLSSQPGDEPDGERGNDGADDGSSAPSPEARGNPGGAAPQP